MNAQSTTKAYTRILDIMLTDMADVYSAGLEAGQCEIALAEQIRTSFMTMFKMDLMEATKCTNKVIKKYNDRYADEDLITTMDSFQRSIRKRSIQNALTH